MKTNKRKWRSIAWAIVLGAGLLGAAAQAQRLREPANPRLADLERLYPDDAISNVAGFCSGRMPDTRVAWDQLLGQWRGSNRVHLDELRRLQDRIDDAVRVHPAAGVNLDDWLAIASARSDLRAAQAELFAAMTDSQARQFCDDARAQDVDLPLDGSEMERARVAGAAALDVLNGRH